MAALIYNYYKLEQPFRIQDSYARPQIYIQSINQGDRTFISILDTCDPFGQIKSKF